jgi:hypothetical protein
MPEGGLHGTWNPRGGSRSGSGGGTGSEVSARLLRDARMWASIAAVGIVLFGLVETLPGLPERWRIRNERRRKVHVRHYARTATSTDEIPGR